jgi:hypothetical protein
MSAKKRPPSRATLLRSSVVDRPLYTLTFEQWEIEAFAAGECPETVSLRAHRSLRWQRAAARQAARIKALGANALKVARKGLTR